jgi:hypothetical protein
VASSQKTPARDNPAHPKYGFPPGTRSQTVLYHDHSGRRIAVVHQFARPDGTLVASRRPDPKCLWEHGTLYALALWTPEEGHS